uniref:Immunoglobulin V-set domain-containing protein n=1 Tax=Neogobius melanostomus TaxID=47308 RepID=A0A8C6USJ6_9GOBI
MAVCCVRGSLLLLLLMILIFTVCSLSWLFVQTGNDVTLDIVNPEAVKKYFAFQWKFNANKALVSATSNGKVTLNSERIDLHTKNFSLTLKNLQVEHSGLYEALVINSNGLHIISSYTITVQVSPVLLSVDSVFNSPESCNFTVSCTTELSPSISRSFTCDRRTCEEASPAPSDPAPYLHLYLSDVSIICNHSNHVSWRKDTKEIQQVCPFGNELILMFDFVLHLFHRC